MNGEPNVFCVVVEGDSSDDDYTGVTKRVTPTGAEYRIVGPLADALRRHDDNWDSAFQRAYGEALNIRAEVPFEFLNAPAGEVDMETYEAVRAMAQEITRLRVLNTEQEAMLLNQAKTIKKMQAEIDALRLAHDRYRRLWEDLRRRRGEMINP